MALWVCFDEFKALNWTHYKTYLLYIASNWRLDAEMSNDGKQFLHLLFITIIENYGDQFFHIKYLVQSTKDLTK